MKFEKYIYLFLVCAIVCACSKADEPLIIESEPEPEIPEPVVIQNDDPDVLVWIEKTMREKYYWYSEIPVADSLNYTLDENAFFKHLLSKKDGKVVAGKHFPFSRIKNKSTIKVRRPMQGDYSYGMEYKGVQFDTGLHALVLYVIPGTPAAKAGLKRGDWIIKIDGNNLTNESLSGLKGGGQRKLTVARWDPNLVDPTTKKPAGGWTNKRNNIQLNAAESVADNPVHTTKILTKGDKIIGYLLYNHFTKGTSDTDISYDNELRKASADFKAAGVNEVVLDLRYNNGGAISSAVLLCTILMPNANLGANVATLTYNDKQTPLSANLKSKAENLRPGGKNLDLKRVYVLTSSVTASSSELVINSLSTFMEVIVIGNRTVGKNVGSIKIPSEKIPYPHGALTWTMHPIVCQISNSLGFSEYTKGFVPGTYNKNSQATPASPGVYINELYDNSKKKKNGKSQSTLVEIFPLGDPNERMLSAALNMIEGKHTRAVAPLSASEEYPADSGSSIDRRASSGVMIDIE